MRAGRPSLAVTPQALTLLLAIFLIHSVWRASGARLAIVAEVAIVTVLLVDLVGSWLITGRVTVTVVEHPRDAVVGQPISLEVEVNGPGAPIEIRMLSAPTTRWHRVTPPDRGAMVAVAPARGVTRTAVIETRCPAPLGLVGVNRRSVVELPHALCVAPRPEEVPRARLPSRGALPSAEEIVRGTRQWAPSDPLRTIHWPTVARTGELMVKELEPPPAPLLTVAVELAHPGDAAERAAARGAWVADEALRRGCRVTLVTIEGDRVVRGAVGSTLDVGRRLAAASSSRRFGPSDLQPGSVVVRSEGDTFS